MIVAKLKEYIRKKYLNYLASHQELIKMLYLINFMSVKLGSTSIGKGVAIPHARLNNIEFPFLSVIILDEAVEFDNIDSLDVDIIVSLIVPEENFNNHLELLANFEHKT